MSYEPIIKEVYIPLTAHQTFEMFQDELYSFFLDSGMDPANLGRYSFIGSQPFLVLNSRGSLTKFHSDGKWGVIRGNPFDIMAKYLNSYCLKCRSYPVPFIGGAVGYFSYDLCHFIERLPSKACDDLQLPECYFAFYDAVGRVL